MKPLLRGHFHQAMFFIILGAGVPLIVKSQSFSICVYVVCALLLFATSTMYHRVNWNASKRLLWKKLDHSCIYLMIAGTMTPVATYGLTENSAKTLLITIWIVALLGVIKSTFFINFSKGVSVLIYIIAGFLIIPYLSELYNSIGVYNVWLIVIGGLLYSIGALAYGFKRPKLNPITFSYHEVFHIFVNAGAILHLVAIYSLIGW